MSETLDIKGRFYPPQSSEGCDGTLRIRGETVFATVFDEGRVGLPRHEIRIEPRIGTMRRKIYLPNGFVFETENTAAVDAIDTKKRWKALARLEKTGWHLIPFAIFTPILAVGFYRLMIPLLISAGLFFTPDGLPKRIDKASLGSLDKIWMRPTNVDAERQRELTALFEQLVAARPEGRERRVPNYELKFRRMRPPTPNAFALPGGTIVLTDSLIRDFGDDDVLAGIIAHEIAHVEYEHSLRQIYRALGMAALINMIAGDAGPMLEDLLLEGSALLSLSFSRKHELQADSYSVPLMREVGRRPDAILGFFETLEAGEMVLPSIATKRREQSKSKIEKERAPKSEIDRLLYENVPEGSDPEAPANYEPIKVEEDDDDTATYGGDLKAKKAKDWFSSHPLHQERIENIKRLTRGDNVDDNP